MYMHESYHFWGMHFFWWIVWIIMLIWIFATPYKIPGQRTKGDAPIDILKKRFALGEIGIDEFQERKKHLESK
ncbi:MAG: hypothetical protein A3D92_22590 [Bacteroidetes bacterium RIFCSPHIGHO2_02_FULL_44_7]|nr:MAG: hypothetical protein A3D92_22590 [Bacteroidetes bacterium RIFCSPHIGHO2_02_FULL_44_7]